jgi:hypothetical protein
VEDSRLITLRFPGVGAVRQHGRTPAPATNRLCENTVSGTPNATLGRGASICTATARHRHTSAARSDKLRRAGTRSTDEATDRSDLMPINWADIPWPVIGLLAALTFVTSLIGHSLTRNAFVGAIITVILFVAIYVFWDFYPHGLAPGIRFPTKL